MSTLFSNTYMISFFERSSGSLGMFETHSRLFGLGTVMVLADGERKGNIISF